MGIYSVKPGFQRSLHGVEMVFIRWHVHPDVLTLGALGLCILGGIALFASRWLPWLLLLVPVIALVRTALNAVDGLVAKDTGVARPWGEVLNEFSDRLADVALFAGVAMAPGSDIRLGSVVIVAILLTSYLGTLSKAAGGPRQYSGVMGKADRMIYLSIASVAAFILPDVAVFQYFLLAVLAGLLLTMLQRLRATHHDLQPSR